MVSASWTGFVSLEGTLQPCPSKAQSASWKEAETTAGITSDWLERAWSAGRKYCQSGAGPLSKEEFLKRSRNLGVHSTRDGKTPLFTKHSNSINTHKYWNTNAKHFTCRNSGFCNDVHWLDKIKVASFWTLFHIYTLIIHNNKTCIQNVKQITFSKIREKKPRKEGNFEFAGSSRKRVLLQPTQTRTEEFKHIFEFLTISFVQHSHASLWGHLQLLLMHMRNGLVSGQKNFRMGRKKNIKSIPRHKHIYML